MKKYPMIRFYSGLLGGMLFLAASFTGCDTPVWKRLPSEPELWGIRAMGRPLYYCLDDDYNLAAVSDTGSVKTALFIEDNPLTEDIAAIAETSSEGYDDSVRIVNKKNGGVCSMFFHKGQNFPWMARLFIDGQNIEATFSQYDRAGRRFSITFEEALSFENLPLPQNAGPGRLFDRAAAPGYSFDPALTENQNIRLRNIYTAAEIIESIGRAFPSRILFLQANGANNTALASFFESEHAAAYAVTLDAQKTPMPGTDSGGQQGLFAVGVYYPAL